MKHGTLPAKGVNKSMLKHDHNLLDTIGKTPLVKLQLQDQIEAQVYAKLELQNIFGMKDRVAKRCILEAKRSGQLKDDAPIVESSSGTMALGVALVGTSLGHDVHIVTDPRIDPITLAKLTAMGCQVHIVNKMSKTGWQGSRLEKLGELLEQYPDAFWPRQYENENNPLAYEELAEEIISELGPVDVIVGAVGSGGSLCGTARALKRYDPALKVVAVDCVGSVIFGQPDYPKRLQSGLGNSLVAKNVDYSIIDEVHWLSDGEAFAATLALARREKIFAGNSSGSVYAVLNWVVRQQSSMTTVVGIMPDRGDRYFNTIYNPGYCAEKGILDAQVPQEPRLVEYGTVVTSWSYAALPREVACLS